VIVLSNLGDKDDVEKAKALGAADYFVKADTDLSVLFEKVNKKLGP
jgi:PleD family two-component response regulator